MKKDFTDITIVLDRSGSMSVIKNDTEGGFNTFIEEQKKAQGTATLTLIQFDTEYEIVHQFKNIQDIPKLTLIPRGCTALLDAIGRTIIDTGNRLSSMKEEDRPEKVVFVIITDGLENASREYTKDKISEMITHQREKYNWEFVFLGANQDAIAVGQSMSISASSSMSYSCSAQGVRTAFAATSANLVGMRSGTKKDMSYSDKDRQEAIA